MRNLARFGLVVLAVVFALASLFNLLRFFNELGVSPARFVIEDAVIALACVLIVVACSMKFRQIGKAQAAAKVADAKAGPPAFKGSRLEADINKPFIGAVFLLLMAIVLFPSYLAWLTPNAKSLFMAGLGIVCGGFVGSILLGYFRPGKPTLVMDGYSLDHAWYGPIRWDQIHGLQLLEIKGGRGGTQQILSIGVAKPGRYLQQLPWAMRTFVPRKRRDAAIGEFRIPLKLLNQSASQIYAAAVELRSRVSPPALKHWYADMTAEQMALQRETDATLARMEQLTASLGEKAPPSARENEEMLRLSEDLNRQLDAAKPFRERDLAKLRRMKIRLYIFTGLVVLYGVLRIWWIVQHKH